MDDVTRCRKWTPDQMVTGKLRVEKRAATQDLSPRWNIPPTVGRLTRFKISYPVSARNSAINLCHSKHPRRFIHAMTAVSNTVTRGWPHAALSTARKDAIFDSIYAQILYKQFENYVNGNKILLSYVIFSAEKGLYIFLLIKFSLFHNFVGSIAEKYSNLYIYPDEIITIYTLLYLNQFSPLLVRPIGISHRIHEG